MNTIASTTGVQLATPLASPLYSVGLHSTIEELLSIRCVNHVTRRNRVNRVNRLDRLIEKCSKSIAETTRLASLINVAQNAAEFGALPQFVAWETEKTVAQYMASHASLARGVRLNSEKHFVGYWAFLLVAVRLRTRSEYITRGHNQLLNCVVKRCQCRPCP